MHYATSNIFLNDDVTTIFIDGLSDDREFKSYTKKFLG